MPLCRGCVQPCDCSFSEDGFAAHRSPEEDTFAPPQANPALGRNFTLIEGNGSSLDPFVISFFDQGEFRPRTAEIQFQNIIVQTATLTTITPVGTGSAIYQSPIQFLINSNRADIHYYYLGASATLADVGDPTSNRRHMALFAEVELPLPGTPFDAPVGGQSTPSGVGDPLTLTASAFVPGVLWNFEFSPDGNTYTQGFYVTLYQNSGFPLSVYDLRIWVTQI